MQKELFIDERRAIVAAILAEVDNAKKKHPRWPTHIVAQAGIIGEEFGELIRECIQIKYEAEGESAAQLAARREVIRKEAIHLYAVTFRFLETLK